MTPATVDWRAADMPKLWRYNLHYFDYLHWPLLDGTAKQQLVDAWIAQCPRGTPDAWEPYPASLRIVNWIKYWLGGVTPSRPQLASLAAQLAWLDANLEYHLLANHLLKNAKALVFGGMYLQGPAADRWLRRGVELLLAETREQILPDGGHIERSPMYHCIALEDLLDVLNLNESNPGLISPANSEVLAAAAGRARDFLAAITAGDGQIPLFNDAAFGIAPEPADLMRYARQVLGGPEGDPAPTPETDGRIERADSGYYGYRHGGESLIIDCGPIGPDYQPGHAHCDTLSYELCLDGHRVIVDSGVPDYEVGPIREQVRGTAAHNTVRVDGEEQSEIWAAFRVARRARPLLADLGAWAGGRLEFRGAHDGYRRLPGRMTHERRVVVERGRSWTVEDRITGQSIGHSAGQSIGQGTGSHRAETFVHLDSACHVEEVADAPDHRTRFVIRRQGLELLLTVALGCAARVEQGHTYPRFGVQETGPVLVIGRQGVLPLELSYEIHRL